MTSRHALVIGASGLAGWGIANVLLDGYPTAGAFEKVTALVNRPMTVAESYWPQHPGGPKLNLVSGIDLTKGSAEEFLQRVNEKVPDFSTVTHVFYFAYKEGGNESEVNHAMAYGAHISGKILSVPLKEEDAKVDEGADDTTHYTALRSALTSASVGKAWSWCEVIPDAIIGFAPKGSTFSIAAHWGAYLATVALVDGAGTKVPFPGVAASYDVLFTEASADNIARQSIWLAIHPEVSSRQAFNVADCGSKPTLTSERWGQLCHYFGLEGAAPLVCISIKNRSAYRRAHTILSSFLKPDPKSQPLPSEYIKLHEAVLNANRRQVAEVWRSDFLDQYGWWQLTDRQFSMGKLTEAGYMTETDPLASWTAAFDRFRVAGMLPEK
ncbi:hypothetical protein P7C70_g7738, partial [Phenoliferia sp. Uapishka_3]